MKGGVICLFLILSACDPNTCVSRPLEDFYGGLYLSCPDIEDIRFQCSIHLEDCVEQTDSEGCVVIQNNTTHLTYHFTPEKEDDALSGGLVEVEDVNPDDPNACATGPNVVYGDLKKCSGE